MPPSAKPAWPTPFLGFPANNRALEVSGSSADSWVAAPFGTLAGSNGSTLPYLTFTWWIYPVGSQNGSAGLIFDRGGAVGGMNLGNSGLPDEISYTWNDNNSDTYDFVTGLTVPTNEWSLAALTIAPNEAVLYLLNSSGRASATNAIPHFNGLLDGAWRIGNDADGDPGRSFNGIMNAVAVFTNVLSGAELNTYL